MMQAFEGTNCGDCEYLSDASGSSTSTPSTTAPTPTTSAPASTTATPATSSPAASSSGSSNATAAPSASSDSGTGSSSTTSSTSSSGSIEGNNAGSTAGSSSSSGGLKTWQVALIICCGVLIFTVAVVSVLSCYCKARNRLYENEDDQADATYYEQQYPRQRQDVLGTGGMATPTLFSQMPTSTRASSRSGSLSNEMKPMYAGSAHGSSDRLVGLAPVHMRNNSGDLTGMAGTYSNERITSGSYPNERIMSGNYPMDRRPSGSNRSVGCRPSVEQTYTARERDSLVVVNVVQLKLKFKAVSDKHSTVAETKML
ncbi:hypothetical protein PHYBOEH_000832 [Phytophthora boehmeriae]|uniref:TKL protein kinase n=1 Tax=Phytophthora boehmeriae TaxID=109152 RepID=A0A8T1WVA0_9STRA|nr:hypothetical protein PHYBOEH_000832 [Phytophthora boehmeriae]